MAKAKKSYPQVFPNIEDWPIYKVHHNRKEFVAEITEFVFQRLKTDYTNIDELIAKTLYLERIRMKQDPWKVDPSDEKGFWKQVSKDLVKKSLDKDSPSAQAVNDELLKSIIHRYAEEIVGTFNKRIFLFIRWFLTKFFSRLLNAVNGRFWRTKYRLYERLQAHGDIELVRSLMKKGTVVVVPTHFSNIDSILVGYVLDGIVGLPSFSYGAGLNLFNAGFAAYFMNRIGAYRVDRRKKNPIYLQTLKAMSTLSIGRGVNTIFFPGGTRSRSGALDAKLKLGLLGTLVEAQRRNYEAGKEEKIFVVPIIMSYHFVLEGKFLIEQHLRKTGKELYLRSKDKSNSIRKFLQFAWTLFWTSNEILVSLGKPMDVLGNFVDADGKSYGNTGETVELKDYFLSFNTLTKNLQREKVYTRVLGEKILERFKADNIVLSSHLVAFAAFQLLQRDHPTLDIYGLLRLPTDDYVFEEQTLVNLIGQLKQYLLEWEITKKIKLSPILHTSPTEIIQDGIKRLGSYHVNKPLYYKKGKISSKSFPLLYYYHNRLTGYELELLVKSTVVEAVTV